jgi:predicted DNA-binding protein
MNRCLPLSFSNKRDGLTTAIFVVYCSKRRQDMRSVLSVSLPENISSELDKFARSTGRTKSDIVKESIDLYLWEARFRKLQKRVGAKAKKAGMVSEEDVFKAIS